MIGVHISRKFKYVWCELRNQHGNLLMKIIHVAA